MNRYSATQKTFLARKHCVKLDTCLQETNWSNGYNSVTVYLDLKNFDYRLDSEVGGGGGNTRLELIPLYNWDATNICMGTMPIWVMVIGFLRSSPWWVKGMFINAGVKLAAIDVTRYFHNRSTTNRCNSRSGTRMTWSWAELSFLRGITLLLCAFLSIRISAAVCLNAFHSTARPLPIPRTTN